MSFVIPEEKFKHIIRMLNTNVEGRKKVPYALKGVRGIGRRFGYAVCKKAGVDINKRAGELSEEEIEKITNIIENPEENNLPKWLLNRVRDMNSGESSQLTANKLDQSLREDIQRLQKIKCNRGIRHFWGYKVRGQHTKTTGRCGYIPVIKLERR